MYTIERSFSFEAAHRLPLHRGKCWNLHGHNYILKVGLSSSTLDGQGMVVDFGHLNACLIPIIEKIDHSLIVQSSVEGQKYEVKTYVITGRQPTAEIIAEHFYYKFKTLVPSISEMLKYVIVEETPGCWAKYEEI